MAWVKIDDEMPRHPKMVSAGALAFALQIAAICYSNSLQTNGFLLSKTAKTLLELKQPQRVINKLVEVGAWDEVEGGYQIHDYLSHQASKDDIDAFKAKKSSAGKKGAEARWGKEKAMANPMAPANGKPMARQRLRQRQEIDTDVSISRKPEISVIAKGDRKRNEIWDAVMEVCRINTDAIPKSARSGYGKVVAELAQLGASPEDVAERGIAYRLAYRDAPLTPHALLKNWAQVEGVATQPHVDKHELEQRQWVNQR